MARVLVLGGGFGGVSTATEVRKALGVGHEIILVDRSSTFVMGLRKLWALVGMGTIEDGSRDLHTLQTQGIRCEQREILSIDAAGLSVATDSGSLAADYMVLALGAESRPDLVPGLVEHGHNAWDVAGVPVLKAAVDAFDRGSIVIAIAGMPYTCPPAPFECGSAACVIAAR
jgi:sulfide:quinone oxidoreductase